MASLDHLSTQLKNPNRHIRYQAIYSLSKRDEPEAIRLLGIALTHDADQQLRAMAAKLLCRKPDPEIFTYLVHALQGDRHAPVRRAAAEAIGQVTYPIPDIAEQALIGALYDRSKHVRRAVVQSLRLLECTDAVPALIGVLLGDADSYVRWEAAQTLDALAPLDAIPAFVEALSADGNSFVRYVAASALGKFGDVSQTLAHLEQALIADTSPHVRYAAATSLGLLLIEQGHAAIIHALIKGLHDTNTQVWHAAAEALWMGGEGVFRVILQELTSPEPVNRQAALKAVLWLSAEFDETYAPDLSELDDVYLHEWLN